MKIAIITFASLPLPGVRGGAVETLIDTLCDENEKNGTLEIDIYSIYDKIAEQESVSKTKTKYYYYKKLEKTKYTFSNVIFKVFHISLPNATMKHVVRMLKRDRYEFVVITSIFRALASLIKDIPFPVLWYLHADALSILSKEEVKKISDSCAAVLTVSEFVKQRILETDTKSRVISIKNCANITPIEEDKEIEVREQVRCKYGVKDSDVLFVYVGRITPIKGILELVRAFGKIKENDIKLLIVGAPSNSHEEEYYELLKKNSNEKVKYAGYIRNSDVNLIYCASDAAVVPSICLEAAGLSVVEPQQCNRIVIASDTGGIPEYCSPENSIMFKCDENIESNLKDALCDFIEKKDDYMTLKKPMKEFSTEQYYKEFCEALQMIKKDI